MVSRIVFVAVAAFLAAAPVAAQVPTVPPTINVTCHGYDEGSTRAYNCIPPPAEQPRLRTFVPPVGSRCNGGQVAEFPPGRIVFQIRCADGAGDTPSTPTPPSDPAADYEIVNIRQYQALDDKAHWIDFTWRAFVSADEFELRLRYQQGAFFTECTETWYDPVAGEQERETSIPSVCGPDDQWSTVTIQPADGRTCRGCGTFRRLDLPESRSLSAESADPLEVNAMIEEFTLRAQIGAAQR